MMDVTLAGVLFQTVRPADDGTRISLEKVEGWWEPAPDVTGSQRHWSGSGTLAGQPRQDARTVSLSGKVFAVDQRELLLAKESISRARRGTLVVDERALGLARQAEVRQVDVTFDDISPTVTRFSVTVLADDPLRYGTGRQALVNEGNILRNRGDADAYGLIELVGPHGPLTVHHPRGTWRMVETPAGVSRLVDLRNDEVWQGGSRVFRLSSGQGPVVRPGGSAWHVIGLGAGQAWIRHSEAWS